MIISRMKLFAVVAVAVVYVVVLGGCGGYRHASLYIDNALPITHSDANYSLFQRSIGPMEMAESYRIKKQADTKEAMITGLMKNQSGSVSGEKAYNYIFALVNNDRSQAVYIDHPELIGEKVIAQPGGNAEFFFLRDLPYKILYRRLSDGKIIREYSPRYDFQFQEKISHKKRIGGVLVDFVFQIDQVS